ncbi:MAG: N-acetylmuramoyl-L-alanine amidase [Firmicutes bacterium]|nr:N-acetylmuramoyl-L-alanine amidase [Bacillota bacterium]
MSRWYVFVLPKRLCFFMLIAVGVIVLLALHHEYPLGIHTLSLVHQEVIYDIMLDPGHGGIDPGAIGTGDIYEKDYVLDIVLQMSEILSEQGLKVGLTRDTDRDVSHLVSEGTRHRRDLLGRFKLMNQAQLGLSVHANATKNPKESGAIVFFMKDQYIDQVYAQLVLEELEKVQVMNERLPIPRNTLLLLKAKPPVLLVEIGFMSNPDDLAKLGDPQFRTSVARALSDGILRFIEWRQGEQSENS